MVDAKRILIVCNSFFPVISPRAFRATELAKEFSRQGHSVKVITPFIEGVDYSSMSRLYDVEFKDLGRPRFQKPVARSNKLHILFVRLINRLLLLLLEFPDIQIVPLVVKALRDEDSYDLIISVAVPYPIHWGVARSRSVRHRIAETWVADCGDPYMGDRIDTFRKMFYLKYIEKWFCRKANYLTVPTFESIKGYYEEFHDKIKVIPQGFDFQDEKKPQEPYNIPISFAYAGNITPVVRDPRPFLDILSTLACDFKFIIYTKKVELLKDYERKLHDKLEIRDYIPRNELLPVLGSMDFLVNFDNNTEVHTPSKLIDYAIVGRPVLNITSSLDKSLINDFLSRDYSRAYIIQDIGQYDIKRVAQKFLELE